MLLDEKLLAQRLQEFTPEPLVDITNIKSKQSLEIPTCDHSNQDTIDLAKANYLNLLNDKSIQQACEKTIREYGVGTCGPRAFYGTTDVHLDLEQRLATFLHVDDAIIYSYGFVAISSSIAAYCKKSDVVFVDARTNFAIEQGLVAARSHIVRFDHNDPTSLRRVALEIAQHENNTKKRKFLICEAVSWRTGRICPLAAYLEIAETFKMRVFLEESYSLGVLGDSGRGLIEHCGLERSRIDMVFGTLEGAVGSIGGFCAGSHATIEHQRLSGAGYIFSASLPTYLVTAAIKSLDILLVTADMGKSQQLVALSKEFHAFLVQQSCFDVQSDPESPFKLFSVRGDRMAATAAAKKVHQFCRKENVHFILREDDGCLMINVSLGVTGDRLQRAFDVIKRAAASINN